MHLVKEVLFMYNTLGHWKEERGQGWGQLLYIPPRCLSSELFKQAVGSCLALHIWVLPASYLEHLCLGFRLGNKSLWVSGSQQPPLSYVTVLSTMCKLKSFTFQKVLNGWVCGLSCRMFSFFADDFLHVGFVDPFVSLVGFKQVISFFFEATDDQVSELDFICISTYLKMFM